ncbi:DNA adenine methylase [Campylobacter upsaliensis]|uniref:DNA adenine methylase n=1 Tax=Campylobacter upsaliensis TaxID=28080 RepID=UPI0022EADBEC|nr:DNA adenine methylase [Campylobacter upsaliensis]MEB2818608.1 DNA adenine methylase [Campylobacter upsaliensis]
MSCAKLNKKEQFIASPLNYVGGKYRLLTQLFPLFPKDINIALDLFCGGANVGINMSAREIILNDSLSELTKLYQNLQQKTHK